MDELIFGPLSCSLATCAHEATGLFEGVSLRRACPQVLSLPWGRGHPSRLTLPPRLD